MSEINSVSENNIPVLKEALEVIMQLRNQSQYAGGTTVNHKINECIQNIDAQIKICKDTVDRKCDINPDDSWTKTPRDYASCKPRTWFPQSCSKPGTCNVNVGECCKSGKSGKSGNELPASECPVTVSTGCFKDGPCVIFDRKWMQIYALKKEFIHLKLELIKCDNAGNHNHMDGGSLVEGQLEVNLSKLVEQGGQSAEAYEKAVEVGASHPATCKYAINFADAMIEYLKHMIALEHFKLNQCLCRKSEGHDCVKPACERQSLRACSGGNCNKFMH